MQNLDNLQANINRVILGKEPQVELLLTALLSEGHVLLEDIPGTGKTTLAKALCQSISGQFNRVQFTPDLLPTDILGNSIYQPKTGEFRLEKGPLFCNLFLADEINRAAPRTQSALLEAMAEHQITLEGETLALAQPFMVIATQNTMESEGVFPLPEAQLDRFILKTTLGYPTLEQEFEILSQRKTADPIESLEAVIDQAEMVEHILAAREVKVHDDILKYLLHLIEQTRNDSRIQLGASPRTSLGLMKFCQALAYVRHRDFVNIQDIQDSLLPVLSHRIFLHPGEMGKHSVDEILKQILETTAVPR